MAKSTNQKLKLYYVLQILREETDENHGITMSGIISKLAENDIVAERKSVGSDIRALTDMGFDISSWKDGKEYKYFLLDREFELAEIKLLIDAVQVSKFISKDETDKLIKKIETLVSKHQAKELNRQVYVANRVKTESDVVIINVDYINSAILENKKIAFEYYDWDIKTESMVKRDNGDKTNISPWMLIWDDENYYMVAYDEESGYIKHYRVDKMKKVKLIDEPRLGRDEYEKVDVDLYSKSIFNMFAGDNSNVKIQMPNHMYSVVVDRFGKDNIWIADKSKDTFTVRVKVNVTDTFYGWLVSLGRDIKVLSPEDVVTEYKKLLEDLVASHS